MDKLHFTTKINAPVAKVWDTMLGKETYLEWTDAFNPDGGSYMEGTWDQGSDVKFLGPNPDGTVSGMFAKIKENRPNEFLSIQHMGTIMNNVEKPWPEPDLEFYENYTFKSTDDGGTELIIDVDTTDEWKDMFQGMWPKALDKLKEIAERA